MRHSPSFFIRLISFVVVSVLPFTAAAEAASTVDAPAIEEPAAPVEDSTRLVFAPTAVGREKGEWGLTVYDLVLADIEYGLAKHLEVGLDLAAPITFVGFGAHAKVWGRLGAKATAALNLWGAFIFPYLGDFRGDNHIMWGGGPLLTLGGEGGFFNIGVQLAGSARRFQLAKSAPIPMEDSTGDETPGMWLVLPTAGFAIRFGPRVSLLLQGDGYVQRERLFDGDTNTDFTASVSYGLRFHANHVALDVAFVVPISMSLSDLLRYCPIGLPMITISKGWPKRE